MKFNIKDTSLGNISLTMLSKVIAIIAYLGVDILCARILNMQDYGTWVFFTSIKNMLVFFAYFGINSATKVVVAGCVEERKKLSILKTAMAMRTIVSLFVALLLFIFSEKLNLLLNVDSEYIKLEILFSVIGLYILFETFYEFFKQVGYGLNNYRFVFNTTSVEFGLSLIATLIFLLLFRDLYGVAIAAIVTGIITLVICTYMLNRQYKLKTTCVSAKQGKEIAKKILLAALPLMACDITNLVALELDTAMLGALAGAEQVAYYNIGKKIVSKAGHVNLAIASGVMTSFAVINSENYAAQAKRFKKYMGLNLLATIAVVVALAILALGGICLLYGEGYQGAQTIMWLLIPYYVMFAVSSFLALFLDFQSMLLFRSAASIGSTVLNVVLNAAYIPKYGAVGATLTTLVAQGLYLICMIIFCVCAWKRNQSEHIKK